MIQVRLYKNYEKRSNSTYQAGSQAAYDDLSCTLKDNCSITAPRMDVLTITQNPAALGYNYAYIPAFNRYYFITDWTYDMGVWSFSAAEDVLASFKAEIGNLTKYVTRASAQFNGNMIDTAYPTLAPEDVTYLYNASPFSLSQGGSYIVGIIGKQQTGVPCVGGINYYLFTAAQMAQFITYLMSDGFAQLMADNSAGFTSAIVKSIASPTDYITTCMWFPFTILGSVDSPTVQPLIGFWDNIAPITGGLTPLSGAAASIQSLVFPVDITGGSYTLTDHPQISRGAYLNAAPYSNYIFHLDPWGDIPLNGSRLLNNRTITYGIECEALSGMATLEIMAGSDLLIRQMAQVGVPMSIAQIITDLSKVGIGNIAAGAVAGVASRVSEVMSTTDVVPISNAYTDVLGEAQTMVPVIGAVGGGGSLLASVGKSMLSGISASISDIDSRGVNGSIISYVFTAIQMGQGFMQSSGPYLKISRFNLVNEDINEIGRPLMAIRQINSIPGYIECSDGQHNIKCLAPERSAIAAYLTGGFLYE